MPLRNQRLFAVRPFLLYVLRSINRSARAPPTRMQTHADLHTFSLHIHPDLKTKYLRERPKDVYPVLFQRCHPMRWDRHPSRLRFQGLPRRWRCRCEYRCLGRWRNIRPINIDIDQNFFIVGDGGWWFYGGSRHVRLFLIFR